MEAPRAVTKSQKMNALLLERAISAPRGGDYLLGPEDLLEIDVFQVEELKRTVRVTSSGFIKLPLAGKVKAAGLTVSGLEAVISERLRRYLEEPVVSVFVKEYRSQRITVLGAVNNPQVYAVTGQKSLLDMLSIAGGLSEDAGDICYVQRKGETIVIDLNDLLLRGNARLNIPVFAGDVIHVPKGGVVFVSGAVNAPGSFVMHGTVTLAQLIAMAKDLKYEARRDEIRIYRDTGKPTRDIIEVNYDEILEGERPDIVLRDKDIVIVPSSGIKNFFAGFVRTLRGLVSFGSVSVGAGM